jgi:cyanate permease
MTQYFLGPDALQNQLFILAGLAEIGGFGLVALGHHPGMFVGATFMAFGIAISKVALPVIGKAIADRAVALQEGRRNPYQDRRT